MQEITSEISKDKKLELLNLTVQRGSPMELGPRHLQSRFWLAGVSQCFWKSVMTFVLVMWQNNKLKLFHWSSRNKLLPPDWRNIVRVTLTRTESKQQGKNYSSLLQPHSLSLAPSIGRAEQVARTCSQTCSPIFIFFLCIFMSFLRIVPHTYSPHNLIIPSIWQGPAHSLLVYYNFPI